MFLPKALRASVFYFIVLAMGSAQTPFENGVSLKEVAAGLQGPSSIAMDSLGRIYVASIYDKYGQGQPTDIYRVLIDNTVETFTAPILDPDVLCLDASDNVYVGSWPGRITQVNPTNGVQTVWLHDTRLGNIDGMTFDANGNLLITAIDHLKVHKVDHVTKQITVFADLSILGLQGFGSIVVNPSDQSVFIASPKDGDLVVTDSNGVMTHSALASGFSHMGQLALDGDDIFVSDNVAGILYRVKISTGQKSVFVNKIHDYAGGLLSLGNNEFYATRQSSDMTDGRLYRIQPMNTTLINSPQIGANITLQLSSPADALRPLYLFLTFTPGSIPLPDGRELPFTLSNYFLFQSVFDANGGYQLPLQIPNKTDYVGITVYSSYVSEQNGIFGVSESFQFTILP